MHESWQADADLGTFDGRLDARKHQPRREHLERYSNVYRKCYEKAYDAENENLFDLQESASAVDALLAPKVGKYVYRSQVKKWSRVRTYVRKARHYTVRQLLILTNKQRSVQPDDAGS